MAERLTKILYVEDEPDIRMVAQLALETVGEFTLEVCGSGAEALERIAAFQPQLVLMDVMMPGMDGPSTLAKIRELQNFKATPVIFMTAKVQPQEVASYKQSGVVGVIPKPFDPMTLANSILEIWERCHG
ncbi:MAG: response regulator [Betaproteobacteria bacterium]|nr:response regulator [Betaproteobacteria bacterium]